MAISEKMRLKAKAAELGIEGFRAMSQDELAAAVKRADTGKGAVEKVEKGAVAKNGDANGHAGKGKAEAVVKGTAKGAVQKGKAEVSRASDKGKTTRVKASTSLPARKSTSQKSSRKPATAAKGVAKRATTGRTAKLSPARPSRRQSSRAANLIDNSKVDWTRESTVGAPGSGKRHDVMKALRKRKGDKDKVFADLQENAVKWYPNALNTYPESPTKKHAAQRMLRWLIGRVAYDFVKKTGQHRDGNRKWTGQTTTKKTTARPSSSGKGRATTAKRKTTPKRAPAKKTAARKGATVKRTPAKKRATAQKGR